jgi:hypothetical protein
MLDFCGQEKTRKIKSENSLMDLTDDAGTNFGAVLLWLSWLTSHSVDDTCSFHLEFNHTIQVKVPIRSVFYWW